MTSTMNHTNCAHPATKAGRAACRKARAAKVAALRVEVGELIYSYYQGDGDYEEIIHSLIMTFPEVHTAYFDTDATPEELIALAARCKNEL